jgi:bifunctional non-homologous end joining protein LigD
MARFLRQTLVLQRGDLDTYRQKRDFERTPEPKGHRRGKGPAAPLGFVVQKHAARRLHYDLRLELDGVLKSWAVPKGPSLVPGERRMAVAVEDHPIEYGSFEGVIPRGEYGAGTVVVWDRGTWHPIGDPRTGLASGKLTFRLEGEKLRGRFHLVRTRGSSGAKTTWLLLKADDAQAERTSAGEITATEPASVLTGRSLEQVAAEATRVWSRGTAEIEPPRITTPGDPSGVAGARRAKVPASVRPQLATLVDAPPQGDDWLHEIKLDGYRLLARKEQGRVALTTRSGQDWTERFASIALALEELSARSAILDGEVVALDQRGRSDFQRLQQALGGAAARLAYYAFDLLALEGWDLRQAPLVERKRLLRSILAEGDGASVVRFSDHVRGRGPAFHREACAEGLEGVVSKRADAPYRSTRTKTWLKSKCKKRQELAIVGFTEPGGARSGFGALVLGAKDGAGVFRYCGKVGTGFDGETLLGLRRELERHRTKHPPVAGAPKLRGVSWVTPTLVAEISFTEWTRDGSARHPVFLGLRADKSPDEVTIDAPKPPPRAPQPRNEVAGVHLSTPERIYWPDAGITKSELAGHYERVASRILPLIALRPLTLLRCPEGHEGECFYQKHANDSLPATIPRVTVKRREAPYTMIRDLPSIIELVQLGTLELHVWGALADRVDRPDILVFDLDPDPSVPWRRLADTARALRELLADLGLLAFVRATGGKGLHVVTPIVRRPTWPAVKDFTHAVARTLVREAPRHYTTSMTKARRTGKIFLDTFRNAPDATAIASYSTRASVGAPVAAPLFWEEIEGPKGPPIFRLRDMEARLREADPWATFEASRRLVTAAARRRVEGA